MEGALTRVVKGLCTGARRILEQKKGKGWFSKDPFCWCFWWITGPNKLFSKITFCPFPLLYFFFFFFGFWDTDLPGNVILGTKAGEISCQNKNLSLLVHQRQHCGIWHPVVMNAHCNKRWVSIAINIWSGCAYNSTFYCLDVHTALTNVSNTFIDSMHSNF